MLNAVDKDALSSKRTERQTDGHILPYLTIWMNGWWETSQELKWLERMKKTSSPLTSECLSVVLVFLFFFLFDLIDAFIFIVPLLFMAEYFRCFYWRCFSLSCSCFILFFIVKSLCRLCFGCYEFISCLHWLLYTFFLLLNYLDLLVGSKTEILVCH